MTHYAKFVPELNAEIDEQIVELVQVFNASDMKTFASCQGDPGKVNWLSGYVAFTLAKSLGHDAWHDLAFVVFCKLGHTLSGLGSHVYFEMSLHHEVGLAGTLRFNNEVIGEICKRVRGWRL